MAHVESVQSLQSAALVALGELQARGIIICKAVRGFVCRGIDETEKVKPTDSKAIVVINLLATLGGESGLYVHKIEVKVCRDMFGTQWLAESVEFETQSSSGSPELWHWVRSSGKPVHWYNNSIPGIKDRYGWDGVVARSNDILSILALKPDEFKKDFDPTRTEDILRAYREGDLTLPETLQALERWKLEMSEV